MNFKPGAKRNLSARKERGMKEARDMLNTVSFGGRLTRDPELRYTPSGVAVASFTLAVDRNFKNSQGERETDFIPHVVYRQLAETVANSCTKASLVTTKGRLQVRTYTGQDGQKRWVYEVVADEVHFMEPKGAHGQQSASNDQWQSPNEGFGGNSGFEVNLDDDIPF
jgi:single stranded DNA-binding protein (ssb)